MPSARGRAACHGCRAKKQKVSGREFPPTHPPWSAVCSRVSEHGLTSRTQCDEKRPACSRCLEVGHACVWPRAKKRFSRGPAKGYVEALEHRLAATEAALLQLYSVVDERLLEAAFQDSEAYMAQRSGGEGGGGGAYAGNGVARQAENKRADDNLAQWECFPLLTAADVKHWAENNLQRPPQRAPVVIVGGTAGGAGGGGSLRPMTLPLDNANAQKDYEREMQEERRRTSATSATSSSGGGDDDDGQVHHLSHRDIFSMTQEFKSQYLW
ncbi:Zn(2)-C6 fungal-type DNA-binding domain protein [Moelleriella libera RCEF 2490]|uniref:Zn(2)-C6 fungal-type DNA-binding domain protein n=1 Tax=Moelleriella libera RCEF 2490 TaxID=1081109 RepID=A0A162IBJ6_9HYPO|nr:Zn(2)-C6 fungal-type DNA-binding domain protein [Moelleriella libera RCEF 2490]